MPVLLWYGKSLTSHKHLLALWPASLMGRALQELLQYKDRDRWYLPTFAANDAPDWKQGRFVRSRQLAPGIREVGAESSPYRRYCFRFPSSHLRPLPGLA